MHPAIYFDYSPSKYQTTGMIHVLVFVVITLLFAAGTFTTLMRKLAAQLVQVKNNKGVLENAPCIVVLDGAPAHNNDTMIRVDGKSKSLWQMQEFPWMYVMFTLPNRSHTLQSGDRHINLTLRETTRRMSKLRTLSHPGLCLFCLQQSYKTVATSSGCGTGQH